MKYINFAIVACVAACSPRVPRSVDGLEGGHLLSDLSTTGVFTPELVTANTASNTIHATSIVTTSMHAKSVDASTIVYRGGPLFGAPVGTTDHGSSGYRGMDSGCRADFGPSAHVCNANEIMLAIRTDAGFDASWSGAAVNAYGFYTAVQFDDPFPNRPARSFIVSDCNGWTEGSGFHSVTGPNGEDSAEFAHTYTALVADEILGWRLMPDFGEARCASTVRLCCK